MKINLLKLLTKQQFFETYLENIIISLIPDQKKHICIIVKDTEELYYKYVFNINWDRFYCISIISHNLDNFDTSQILVLKYNDLDLYTNIETTGKIDKYDFIKEFINYSVNQCIIEKDQTL